MTSNDAALREALTAYSTDQIRVAARLLDTLLAHDVAGYSEEGFREVRELVEDLQRLADDRDKALLLLRRALVEG